ncbi:hypothetical protein [Enterovibrio norvegicus]|uniref:hypothetical protein n=1 Tax=Enterovibrio norvegicus TaxID=188144 RepID=UPI0010BEFC76|nr:hypothetical protein [Enterovibrio norvegicus]TKF32454.1 hypothetical protein FCV83_13095 [Enterovibrio norvegicus]
MLSRDELERYRGFSYHCFTDAIKDGAFSSTEVDMSGMTFLERMEALDDLRAIHNEIKYVEGGIELIAYETKLSRDSTHIYLTNFSIYTEPVFANACRKFEQSLLQRSVSANKPNLLKKMFIVVWDYLLISLLLFVLARVGLPDELLKNPFDHIELLFKLL